jgi:hypothetical protein|tara:strand:- start:9045 stop:9542 length:498 start_codon:yes stop_codon:yes gene_type:complete
MEIGTIGEIQVIEYLKKRLNTVVYLPYQDKGIDFIIVKGNKFYQIQVKTSKLQKFSYFWFDLMLDKMIFSNNTIYIFNCFVNERRTFMGKKRNFLVIPSLTIKNWIKRKKVRIIEKKISGGKRTKTIRFFIYPDVANKIWKYRGGLKSNPKIIDLTSYWNKFSVI